MEEQGKQPPSELSGVPVQGPTQGSAQAPDTITVDKLAYLELRLENANLRMHNLVSEINMLQPQIQELHKRVIEERTRRADNNNNNNN